jgi:hypothetical protein
VGANTRHVIDELKNARFSVQEDGDGGCAGTDFIEFDLPRSDVLVLCTG